MAQADILTVRHKPVEIVYRSIDSLRLNPKNPRDHSQKQIKQIARSIKTFGFLSPALIDKDSNVVAGHGRIMAAKTLNLNEIPTICLEHLTPHQVRAYTIADNRLAENATWNEALLTENLEMLASVDLDFDLEVIGFDIAEIDLRIENDVENAPPEEPTAVPTQAEAVSRPGDVWRLGRHMVVCGDALEQQAYKDVLGDRIADVVFTDPPYNVPIAGHASGKGRNKHTDFLMASGEMASEEFAQFLTKVCRNLSEFSRDGSVHFICMDWRHIRELSAAGDAVYSEFKNICVWVKTNAGMGSFYRSQHEFIFVYKKGRTPHRNNVQLGQFGRNRTNVWTYAGATAPQAVMRNAGLSIFIRR